MGSGDGVKVLYVAGAGRSGSTLLECVLGQLRNVFAAGELTHIWDRGFSQNQLCGCETPFGECPFWQEVVRDAFGSGGGVDYAELLELRRFLCANRRVHQLAVPSLRRDAFQSKLERYRAHLRPLYQSIQRISGCDYIIDSSKYPAEAFLLSSVEGIHLAVIHLVRNSNAVAYAWQKWKVRPEVYWKKEFFARYSPAKTAMAWNIYNLLIASLQERAPYVRIRYEDLVENPRESIAQICNRLGVVPVDLDFIGPDGVELGGNHTVSGNPVRFKRGRTPLKLDREWEKEAPAAQRLMVDLITFGLQKRYGYR